VTTTVQVEVSAGFTDEAAEIRYADADGLAPSWPCLTPRPADASALEGLEPPRDQDDWDEPRLGPFAQPGMQAIDDNSRKLHAAAAGTPVKRRGPGATA